MSTQAAIGTAVAEFIRIGTAQYFGRDPYPWDMWVQVFDQIPVSYHSAARALGLRIESIEHRDTQTGEVVSMGTAVGEPGEHVSTVRVGVTLFVSGCGLRMAELKL